MFESKFGNSVCQDEPNNFPAPDPPTPDLRPLSKRGRETGGGTTKWWGARVLTPPPPRSFLVSTPVCATTPTRQQQQATLDMLKDEATAREVQLPAIANCIASEVSADVAR